MAIIMARMSALVNDPTSKPEKNLSAIFITIASTISRTKNDNRPSVRIFKGSLSSHPIVAFNRPITNATSIAVPKLLIFTVGIILAASNNMAALINSCNIQFIE